MGKSIVLMAVLILMLTSFAGLSARADSDISIDTYGGTPFLYMGHSYIPLRSASSFLGAPLRWEAAKNRSVMNYNGKELIVIPGSRNAWFDGRPVRLSAAPIVRHGRIYLPLDALKRTYNVPVEWDRVNSRVRIRGERGWGFVAIDRRPPGWAHGRKTGWAKHGNANTPPGLSKNNQQGPPKVIVVEPKSHKDDKGKGHQYK